MTNNITNDPRTKQLISERESELAGHVRQLRDALWEQLRRPSAQTRERASEVLETTRGELAACPDDEPWQWLDLNTIDQCADFVGHILSEYLDPAKGDAANAIPRALDPETLRYVADVMRRELPDITNSTTSEIESLYSAHLAFKFFYNAIDRYSVELGRLRVRNVTPRHADEEQWHLVDESEVDEDGETKASTPALCGATVPDGWESSLPEEGPMCVGCIRIAIERGAAGGEVRHV